MSEKSINNETDLNSSDKLSLARILRKMMSIHELGIIIPLFLVILIIGIIRSDVFFSYINIGSILRLTANYGIVAIGVSLVIIVGSIDISVGSVAALGACVSAILIQKGLPIYLCVLVALLVTAGIGLINGLLVTKMKMHGFIVTIGTLFVARGIAILITNSFPLYPLSDSFKEFGTAMPLGISWAFILCIVLLIVFEVFMRKTIYGRRVYAVGDNSNVSILAGINVDAIIISTFVITSILAGISGIFVSAQLNSGDPSIGTGWELYVVSGCAVGGISLLGGAGTLLGSFLGILLLAVLINGMVLLGIDPQIQITTTGVILIGAVLLDMYRRNRLIKTSMGLTN